MFQYYAAIHTVCIIALVVILQAYQIEGELSIDSFDTLIGKVLFFILGLFVLGEFNIKEARECGKLMSEISVEM